MRVLLLKYAYVHPKNLHGFRAMCAYAKAQLTESEGPVSGLWDLVWIPSGLPRQAISAKRVILGPHNFVLPEPPWTNISLHDGRTSYNCLSKWNKKAYEKFGGVAQLPLECLPYPVETARFSPSVTPKTHNCFLYTKLRNVDDIKYALDILDHFGLTYKVLNYGSYTEDEYQDALDAACFGVWVGRHESQGFALQEALSSNVPLVVWDIETMAEEWSGGPVYSGSAGDTLATSVPYWDARCGIIVNRDGLKEGIKFMKKNWPVYQPREFVLDNLSVEACAEAWGLKGPF